MENMQESLVASAAGNATAGRELRGLSPHRRSLFSDQTALGNNIRTHADQDQHWCRPPSAPMLNRVYLFYGSFFHLSMGSGGWAASLHRPNLSSGIFAP
jgi:hypothetical protein